VSKAPPHNAEPLATEPPGLVRERLLLPFAAPSFRVGWVVAPAGSGKTRLLEQVAHRFDGPVVWLGSPQARMDTEAAFVAWVASGWAEASANIGGPEPLAGPLVEVADLLRCLAPPGPPCLVVIDDLQLLENSGAERSLAKLVEASPTRLRLLFASRWQPGFDLSRLRVSGQGVELTGEDLRFRAWEVEELFRDYYKDPLHPEEAALLARRSGGWAAYLQLFHLARAAKPVSERRRLLSSLRRPLRQVSEYLGHHVISNLRPELQAFLLEASVLRCPTPQMCAELLGEHVEAESLLAELVRRQLFTERSPDGSYRFHAVLLGYLDSRLVEIYGMEEARRRHAAAGSVLERAGRQAEALAAYLRAQDWEGVERLLGHEVALEQALVWSEEIPHGVGDSDPLVLLARARVAANRGNLHDASELLRRAEAAAGSASLAQRCRDERSRLAQWMGPADNPGEDWLGVMRMATQGAIGRARSLAEHLHGAPGRFASAMVSLIGWDLAGSARIMRTILNHPEATPTMCAVAMLVQFCSQLISGPPVSPAEVDRLVAELEASGSTWLTRVARALLTAEGPDRDELFDDLLAACDHDHDRWGAAIIKALRGIGLLANWPVRAVAWLEESARGFEALGAPVPQAGALTFAALGAFASGDRDRAYQLGRRAAKLAEACEFHAAAALDHLVVGEVSSVTAQPREPRRALEALGIWAWLEPILDRPDMHQHEQPAKSADAAQDRRVSDKAVVRLLGGFSMTLEGKELDLSGIRPMERQLLWMMAVRLGRGWHREELLGVLWPDAEPEVARHRLQVAISSLRGLLGAELLDREAESYRLALPEGSNVDTRSFEQILEAATRRRLAGSTREEMQTLEQALAIYQGPLLPEAGPAEWVVGERDRLNAAAIGAAERLSTLQLAEGEAKLAAQTARWGLALDRYRDELWKLLVAACEDSGNRAEAARYRAAYEEILKELGL